MAPAETRTARVGHALLIAAALYSAFLLAWAAAAGTGVLLATQPLVATAVMTVLLRRRATAGGRAVTFAGTAFAGLFFAYSVLGALSIAYGALPAAVLLLVANVLAPFRPAPARAAAAPAGAR